MDKHRCGGWLLPAKVKIRKKMGVYFQNFTVDGFQCDNCDEKIISRATASEIDKTIQSLKNRWREWRIPADTKESSRYSGSSVKTLPDQLLLMDNTNNVSR
jgi:hypothetical protein